MICSDGWNTRSCIIAFPDPRLNVCNVSPPSALKILMTVPRCDADAIKVPSGLTLRAPRSVSCAWITLFILFSATKNTDRGCWILDYFHAAHKCILTVIEDFDWTFCRVREGNYFRDRSFVCCDSAKACWIRTCFHLLDKLESEERENECLLLQYDN